MSKPRLFIGSSVEGLSVAYAIQENLKFTCESTVWDQGVFNLSEMSVESLLDHLDNADFGVFVFTPDDHIKIRGKKHLTVRDNVLFELGLFIGRLGKQRCFIIIPDNKDFHLPTDLIGVTPAKYEATRTDGNLQAGSGSASHKIREVIAKLGSAAKSKIEPEKPQAANEATDKNKEQDWFNLLFIEKDYDQAIASLKKKIRYEKESDEKVHLKSNICYAEFQKDAHRGKLEYEKLISENSSNNICYLAYANILFWNNSISKAIEIIETGLLNCERKIALTNLKADCLWEINQKEKAVNFLTRSMEQLKDPMLFTKLASLYTSNEEKNLALEVLHKGFVEYPNNEEILSALAKVSYDIGHNDVCVLIYKELVELKPQNSSYWCLLGNAYLELELDNLAMTAYEKANEIAKESEGWIVANIGNLFNNKGFFDKAEYFLTLSRKLTDKSDYTHDRLSQVYVNQQAEKKKLAELLKTAKIKMNGSILA